MSRPELAATGGEDIHDVIMRHAQRRWTTRAGLGIKVNLYTAPEVSALAAALDADDLSDCPVECVMVGDSYFMTHLSRPSTRLATPAERTWGVHALARLVAEVRGALSRDFDPARRPYLIADLPDGTAHEERSLLRAAAAMMDAGADVVKVEVPDAGAVWSVDRLAHAGFPVIAHLGYTPQGGALRRHGDSLAEALALFALARSVRGAGACALVLEMVDQLVNRLLSSDRSRGLPVYSVFSGTAPFGGQSLNVWDAVFRPPFRGRYFPPTAAYDAATERHVYTHDVIADRLGDLLRLTVSGAFPLSPPSKLSERDAAALMAAEPWSEPRGRRR